MENINTRPTKEKKLSIFNFNLLWSAGTNLK